MRALIMEKKVEMLVLDQPESTVGAGCQLWHVSVPSRWSDAPGHLWLVRADDIEEAVTTALEQSRKLYMTGEPDEPEDPYADVENLEQTVADATYLIGTFSEMAQAAEAVCTLERTVYSHQEMTPVVDELRSALVHAHEYTGP
jgi:hypothetical protein